MIYSINKVIAISAIFPKSIPLPPEILLTNPLNISVVAFPNILGPTMVNIVLPIANRNTMIKAILYFPKYPLINFFVVFFTSFTFGGAT